MRQAKNLILLRPNPTKVRNPVKCCIYRQFCGFEKLSKEKSVTKSVRCSNFTLPAIYCISIHFVLKSAPIKQICLSSSAG